MRRTAGSPFSAFRAQCLEAAAHLRLIQNLGKGNPVSPDRTVQELWGRLRQLVSDGHATEGPGTPPAGLDYPAAFAAVDRALAWCNASDSGDPAEGSARGKAAGRLNPKRPPRAKTGDGAADADVTGRAWLLIDVDPVKAKGHGDDSATDAEKASAHKVLYECKALLEAESFTGAVVCDSGNDCGLRGLRADAEATPDGPTVESIIKKLAAG